MAHIEMVVKVSRAVPVSVGGMFGFMTADLGDHICEVLPQ